MADTTPDAVLPDGFDLASFVAPSEGITKVRKLILVAQRVPSLAKSAYSEAIAELKRSQDTATYQRVVEEAQSALGVGQDVFPMDQAWVTTVGRRQQEKEAKLKQQLTSHRQNQNNQGVQDTHEEMGEFYVRSGDFQTALAQFKEMRDHAQSRESFVEATLQLVKAAIYLSSFNIARSEASRIIQEAAQRRETLPVKVAGQLRIGMALYNLRSGIFSTAAKELAHVDPSLANSIPEIIGGRDIALIGGLCALASLSRQQLKEHVAENPNLLQYLDRFAPDLKKAIFDFLGNHYDSCFKLLAKIRPWANLDLNLHRHVDALYAQTRERALTQYFKPFSSVSLTSMALAFGESPEAMEAEVSKLIVEGRINARIDSHNKVLFATRSDQRSATFQRALKLGDQFARNSRSLLLRMSLIRNGMILRSTRRVGGRGGGGPGGGKDADYSDDDMLLDDLGGMQQHMGMYPSGEAAAGYF